VDSLVLFLQASGGWNRAVSDLRHGWRSCRQSAADCPPVGL